MDATNFPTLYARLTGAVLLLTGLAGIAALASGSVGFLALDFLAWDTTHNLLHVLLGAIALYVGFAPSPLLEPRTYAKAFGAVYLLLAFVGFVSPNVLGLGPALGLHLELGENLIHLLVGGLGVGVALFASEAAKASQGARRIA